MKNDLHKNHRHRLREKVKNHGLDCLAYHEVLELLLTYAIPRKDTNPIAHDLIKNFGSFSNAIDADYYDLLKVEGVGPESALFINVLSSFMEVYNKSKLENKVHILNNTGKCAQFFREHYSIKSNEFMVMACLGKNKRVIKTFLYKGNDEVSVSLDLRNIANKINDNGVRSVVLFHTHPNGSVEPSVNDIETTQKIINVCLTHGIDLDDHIILNETEHYSFSQHALIANMKMKYINAFGVMSGYVTSNNDKKSNK